MDDNYPQFIPQSNNEQMTLSLMQRLDKDLIQEMLKPADVLEEIEHKFRNEKWVITEGGKGKWHRDPNSNPLMNEEGINTILGWINPLTSRAVILSYFDDKDIRTIVTDLDFDVIDQLETNCYKWEIDESNLSFVNKLVLILMWASLNRALEGGERVFLGKTIERKELIGNKEKEKGWIGKILQGGR